MDNIPIRPLRFGFEQILSEDMVWSRSSPQFAMFINAFGVHVPHFERFLVAVMREVRGELQDEQLRQDVKAIIGQEAYHAFNFEGWTRRLIQHYPALERPDQEARSYFQRALAQRSRKFKVGFMAGYETFTFLGGMIILDRYEEFMADADPVLRALWVWHQVEEVEHGAVAFEVYQALYGECVWYRRGMVLLAFLHMLRETFVAYAPMLTVEKCYATPRRALKAWGFLLRIGMALARSALPVMKRNYSPRTHPLCNERQNRIAVAWRAWTAAGGNPHHLSDEVVLQMQREHATPYENPGYAEGQS